MDEQPELVSQLLKVIVGYTWFFESCDDETLDPDTAIKQMEYASYLLGQLGEADRSRLVRELRTLAEAEPDGGYREFVKTFAFTMGLVDEQDE
jgi:hypothetical protein